MIEYLDDKVIVVDEHEVDPNGIPIMTEYTLQEWEFINSQQLQ